MPNHSLKNPIILIPARMGSKRLPGKPLLDIGGLPMIVQVWKRAMESKIGPVVVACDGEEIAEAVYKAGGEAVVTKPDHPTGSDRIWEALTILQKKTGAEYDAIINVQGDLPTLDPNVIRAAYDLLGDPGVDIGTLAVPIEKETDKQAPQIVKAVIDMKAGEKKGRGIYFSRLPVPAGEGPIYHHIGLYAYRRSALAKFVAAPPAPLEQRESLEQLRALALGMHIAVAVIDTVPLGVDTPADLEVARKMFGEDMSKKRIAFQGAPGAYSDLACRAVYPRYETLPCMAFEDVFAAVRDGKAELAMIPIENSVAGRVADVHHLLPKAGLHIIGEHYQPIVHHLLALPGAKLSDIKRVESHVQALAQCRQWLRKKNIRTQIHADTAGSAADVAKRKDKSVAAIASELAGKIYGLKSLAKDIADGPKNTTRFLIVSKKDIRAKAGTPCVTTLVFEVRNIPAALYKALGGFATNSLNMTKLESYLMCDGTFKGAQFRMDVEGHPNDKPLKLALEELSFFAKQVKILGVYPAHKFRRS